jgi:hypothetical protein
MDPWFWEMQIAHYRKMRDAFAAHGDHEGAEIFVSAEAAAIAWLGKLHELRNSTDYRQTPSA